MAELFECPSCGASLELDHDDDNLVQCQHCGKSVVIPEALRRKRQVPVQPVQTEIHVISSPNTITFEQPKSGNVGRVISCFVIFVVIFVLGTTVLSIAAPLVMTGLIAKIVGDSSGIVKGLITTEVAGQNPEIGSTIQAIEAMVGTLTPAAPSFAKQVLAFGGEGTGPGRFDDSRSIAVDTDGNIYTGEYSDHRIQKFSPEGKYLTGWTAEGSNAVQSMAASRAGTIYVVSTGKIYQYDTEGNSTGIIEAPDGEYLESVAITADNGLVAASNRSIYRFDSDNQLLFSIENAYQSASDSGTIVGGIAADGLGNIYAPIQYTQQGKFKTAIFIFTPEGKYSDRFGSDGDGPGQFQAFHTMAIDGAGRIYVTDIKGIQVFSQDGAYLDTIDVEGVAFGLWFDDAGALYVASNADQIFKYEILP
jgi:sugar lactone lactonase YvrE/DNA-directed RNA polymerase subunit RPC12/RpoP